MVSQGWAENIAYGRHTAREIVLALIVDDGVRGRGHRKNIFNPTYNVAGAAYGSHARFGSVCSIDFASGCAENRLVRAGSDAQNSLLITDLFVADGALFYESVAPKDQPRAVRRAICRENSLRACSYRCRVAANAGSRIAVSCAERSLACSSLDSPAKR